ncbi:MAG: radical SAM protein [Pirellulaceae bacterium]
MTSIVAVPQVTAELFVVPLEGAYLVYAPLQKAAFVADGRTVNRIVALQEATADLNDRETDRLVEFLRRLGIVEGAPEIPPITHFSGQPKPTMVTLFLTTSCNLRCTYCYASAGDTPKRAMSLEVAKQGIDFIIQNALELQKDEVEIAYHGGGEPTVNWNTLTQSYDYASLQAAKSGLKLRAAMASNGILSDDQIDWVLQHLDGVSLSFDGLPAAHDAHRLTVLGQPSSAHVLRTIQRFDESNYNYALRLTVTHDQIGRLADSITFICQKFHPRRIQVEPAYQLGRWTDAPSAETQSFLDQYRAGQAEARKYGQDIHFSGARLGTQTNHFCGITQDSFALTADGNVSACYEVFLESLPRAETFIYGHSEPATGGYHFELPVLNHLREQTVDKHAFCQGCFAKWSCGSDCFHKSLAVNGEGEFAGSDRCHIIRELTKDQILDRVERSGGLFWHDPPTTIAGDARGKELLF